MRPGRREAQDTGANPVLANRCCPESQVVSPSPFPGHHPTSRHGVSRTRPPLWAAKLGPPWPAHRYSRCSRCRWSRLSRLRSRSSRFSRLRA